MTRKIRIGITIGDPSGIGPVITLKALNKLKSFASFTVIGDKDLLRKTKCSAGADYKLVDLKNINLKKFSFGRIKAEYGRASIDYLDKALQLIKSGAIDCIVTCPISKEAINSAGFNYSGHTEFFSRRTNTRDFVMMLLNSRLKLSLVTRHIPLRKVADSINVDKIIKTVLLTHKSLKNLFLINQPRIVICGLNPHASDNGVIGNEENDVLKPAIKMLRAEIKFIDGPVPADAAIEKTFDKKYDCAVAMYHDQALIPLKLSGRSRGVNITLGLPFIRTSPLHGTAFDIAQNGRDLADPGSLIASIKLAAECFRNLRKSNSGPKPI